MHGLSKYIILRNIASLIIVCEILYWAFPFPPFVWRLSLVMLSLLSFFFSNNKTRTEKLFFLFAVFNTVYFVFAYAGGDVNDFTQIGNILSALLPLLLFAYLSEKNVATESYITIYTIALLIASIFTFYHSRNTILSEMASDNAVVNASSLFLFILPLVFLIRNKLCKWCVLAVCLFFLLFSAKRGNILACIIPVFVFLYCEIKESFASFGKTIIVLFAVLVFFGLAYQWVSENEYLQYRYRRTLEGYSSSRDFIYSGAWKAFVNSDDIGILLFGNGFDGICRLHGLRGYNAHNDWLESLINYGIVGAFIYLLLFLSIVQSVKNEKVINYKFALLSIVFIWLFKSAYSMMFTANTAKILMISLGLILGQSHVESKNNFNIITNESNPFIY